jgi:hypothetical protein
LRPWTRKSRDLAEFADQCRQTDAAGRIDLNAQGTKKQRDAASARRSAADVDRDRKKFCSAARQDERRIKETGRGKRLRIVVDSPYAPYFKASLEITNDLIAAYDKAYPAAAPPAKK